jgi:hypothetical protein
LGPEEQQCLIQVALEEMAMQEALLALDHIFLLVVAALV